MYGILCRNIPHLIYAIDYIKTCVADLALSLLAKEINSLLNFNDWVTLKQT